MLKINIEIYMKYICIHVTKVIKKGVSAFFLETIIAILHSFIYIVNHDEERVTF